MSDDTINEAFAGAEDVPDPIEELLAAVANAGPGAAFRPEALAALAALAALKARDRGAFETLLTRLKKAGMRVAELEKVLRGSSGGKGIKGDGLSQVDILLLLAVDASLFRDRDGKGFADIVIAGHRETWPIRSHGFRQWLRHRYYEQEQSAANREAENAALNTLEAKAAHGGVMHPVCTRIGRLGERLYLDLADERWRAVEIDADGWRIVDAPPVRFQRSAGMQALPEPARGGTIAELRPYLNVKRESDFILSVTWLLAAFRDKGPFTILAVAGEQGSAKSSFCRVMRALIDPNAVPLRTLPRDEDELFISAGRGHVLAYDNISQISHWLSDALCRIATGGGLSKRELYSDGDEVLFQAQKPLILNGITDFVERPDLADRALFVTLAAIPEDRRRTETDVWAGVDRALPRILGALLDAVATGLRRLPTTTLARLPRMADFALWGTACLGSAFTDAYAENRADAAEVVIAADAIASAVRGFMAGRETWEGTATDCLQALTEAVGERVAKDRDWPKRSNALSARLRRAAFHLRKIGIEVRQGDGSRTMHARMIFFQRSDIGGKSSSSSSSSSYHNDFKELRMTIPGEGSSWDRHSWAAMTIDDDPMTMHDDPLKKIVMCKSLENIANDDHDDHDDLLHPLSEDEKKSPGQGRRVAQYGEPGGLDFNDVGARHGRMFI